VRWFGSEIGQSELDLAFVGHGAVIERAAEGGASIS